MRCEHDQKLWECIDCNACTNCISEYYMVHDEVWKEAVTVEAGDRDHTMLCIGCLENRLKRQLVPTDFTEAPINDGYGFSQSMRLKTRLGFVMQGFTCEDCGQTLPIDEREEHLQEHIETEERIIREQRAKQ